MSALDYIKMEAISLDVGQTITVECCFCEAPKKLSITRKEDGIIYNCWRASCSGKGFIGELGSIWMHGASEVVNTFKPRPYTQHTYSLSSATRKMLVTKYQIAEWNPVLDLWKANSWDTMLIMPLYDRQGDRYGHTTKYFGNMWQKAMHYIEIDKPTLCYPSCAARTRIVLVEDVISAVRITQLNLRWVGVALLGTDVNDKKVRDLKKYGARDIILALDPDAIEKAFKIQKKYGLFFSSFKVAVMTNDPKDLPDDQLLLDLGL